MTVSKESHANDHTPRGRRQRRYDLSAVFVVTGVPNLSALARATGVHLRLLQQWRRDGGVPDQSADRLAVRLGVLPYELWPDWLDEAGA